MIFPFVVFFFFFHLWPWKFSTHLSNNPPPIFFAEASLGPKSREKNRESVIIWSENSAWIASRPQQPASRDAFYKPCSIIFLLPRWCSLLTAMLSTAPSKIAKFEQSGEPLNVNPCLFLAYLTLSVLPRHWTCHVKQHPSWILQHSSRLYHSVISSTSHWGDDYGWYLQC